MLWLWRVNQIINALVLIAVVAVLGFLVVTFVRSLVVPESDRHGYGLIFSAVLAIVAIALLVPLVAGATQLRRRQRAGAACQVATGAIAAVISAIVPGPFWPGIVAGILVAAPAVPLLVSREPATQ
jgi:hypothetical protein